MKTSFPITRPPGLRADPELTRPAEPRTYVVCLNCGKEIPYSWEKMSRLA